jgi:hypothetical protein
MDNMNFDYKSREMEKGTPVCVACLNASRAHQIPGEYEHICGKQPANNASDTQLPDEVVAELKVKAKEYASELTFNAAWVDASKIDELRTTAVEDWEAGATEYASKLHHAQQEFGKVSTMFLDLDTKHEQARALLQKFISRHEAGLLPDRFIYDEIKTFLDGK